MLSIVSFQIADEEKATQAFLIRSKVFVEEQNVSRDEEYDQYEEEATHYLAYFNGIPAGTSRWRFTTNGIKLERFAVLSEFRKKGVGSLLVQTVLKDVIPLKKQIYLHSQVSAMFLYEKSGFVASGPLFYEANIPHYKMIYNQ